MFKLTNLHADWYEDGIEGGRRGPEQLWRLDPNEHIQVQLFAKPLHWNDDEGEFDGPEDEYSATVLFIERDTRDGPGGRRVYYACKTWVITDQLALELLQAGNEGVSTILAKQFAEVMALPNMPDYCDPPDLTPSQN